MLWMEMKEILGKTINGNRRKGANNVDEEIIN
jgi:hypothetical protein